MAGALGSTPGIIVGVGVGAAASAALQPAVELPRQKAWADNPNRVLDPNLLARLVAAGGVPLGEAQDEAKRSGYGADKLDRLIYLSQTVPGEAELLALWRRNPQTFDELWRHAHVKDGLDPRYVPFIEQLFTDRLDPAVVAVAIQRTVMSNPDILPNQPSTQGSNVPPMPQVSLDPIIEARARGIDPERLAALTRIVGLPASSDLAARMHFRKIITEGAFNQAILEGNTRGEWAPFLLDGFREILTANQYAELQLRGFYDRATRLGNTAKHGMSAADSDLLFNVLGRSIPVHQIVTGESRGGVFNGPSTQIPTAFLQSIQRSNVRPEYYNLAFANRYSYPSAFVVRALLRDGALTEAEGEQIFLDIGWRPDLARKVAVHYAPTGAAVADKHVEKAQTQLWTTTHRSYIAEEATDADASARFDLLGIPAPAQAEILSLWASERALIRAQLTPVQIRKAVTGGVTNPATGVAWTQADALAALLARGYDQADAQTFLAE